jgi:hypothetical protein
MEKEKLFLQKMGKEEYFLQKILGDDLLTFRHIKF